ncbi:uncharacterized protein SPPG_09404 [Spizellomyces punctatus DAOM BR117]|uniref:Uncharacterized protein n=1 Tax=Spizellomyces punctatus (strain DAOM BR117) TaxID=645134 RepID=A0A0L0HAN6_SPIPD|nr:uncharacterized protein SPPG_09404 [Spizellomyces punctatus DAOM BR117]KNC97773.1 hypothetical protein SPPG_09404 [Spizellomyces punctatus DAOM BR117]|eukprot:XP_016605813.1 hypothetical protein SPPG_09404 [Spizellomyces punctatus DAOM BR117]
MRNTTFIRLCRPFQLIRHVTVPSRTPPATHFNTPRHNSDPEPGKVSSIPPTGKGMDPADDAVTLANEGDQPAAGEQNGNGDDPGLSTADKASCIRGESKFDNKSDNKDPNVGWEEDVKRGWIE